MRRIETIVQNFPTSQSVCELNLWKPEQGTIPEAVPVSLDLDFDFEEVDTGAYNLQIRFKSVTLHLTTINCEIMRGTELGLRVLDPEMTTEVTQTIRDYLSNETHSEGTLHVEVKQNVFGKMFAFLKRTKRTSAIKEHDQITRSSIRISRITPRSKQRWTILEPIKPFLLKGRYIGLDNTKEVGPLCLLHVRSYPAKIQVTISINRNDFHITRVQGNSEKTSSRNKEAIINQLVRRSINPSQVANLQLQPNYGRNDVVLARSLMEINLGP